MSTANLLSPEGEAKVLTVHFSMRFPAAGLPKSISGFGSLALLRWGVIHGLEPAASAGFTLDPPVRSGNRRGVG
jgi:hypothetical protein